LCRGTVAAHIRARACTHSRVMQQPRASLLPAHSPSLPTHTTSFSPPSRIIGSSGAFVVVFTAAFGPGDRVAMASPGYPCYRNILGICVCVHVCMCACVYVCMCVCVCACICVYINTHTHAYIHVHACMHAYIHTYTHTHAHTHTHTRRSTGCRSGTTANDRRVKCLTHLSLPPSLPPSLPLSLSRSTGCRSGTNARDCRVQLAAHG